MIQSFSSFVTVLPAPRRKMRGLVKLYSKLKYNPISLSLIEFSAIHTRNVRSIATSDRTDALITSRRDYVTHFWNFIASSYYRATYSMSSIQLLAIVTLQRRVGQVSHFSDLNTARTRLLLLANRNKTMDCKVMLFSTYIFDAGDFVAQQYQFLSQEVFIKIDLNLQYLFRQLMTILY